MMGSRKHSIGPWLPWLLPLVIGWSAWSGSSSVAAKDIPDVATQARATQDQFQPWTEDDLARCQHSLERALTDLERVWSRQNAERYQGWRRYLQLDLLQAQVAAGSAGDLDVLQLVLARFYHSHVGLELQELRALRHELRCYLAALELIQHPDQRALVATKLESLLTLSNEQAWQLLPVEGSLAVGETYAWLKDTGIDKTLADEIARQCEYPNARVTISKNMVPEHLLGEIKETTPIRENISGVAVSGTANTRTKPEISLFPNEQTADVRLVLSGETNASATSRQGRVRVQSTLVTQHSASKQLTLNNEHLQAYPARFEGRTSGRVESVYVDRILGKQLIESIAWNKALEMMPAARVRTTSKINDQVTARLDAEVNDFLKKLNQYYNEFVSGPLARLGFRPAIVGTRTTDHTLDVALRVARLDQLAAPSATPAAPIGADVGLAVHESFIPNVFDVLAGGLRMSDEEVERFIEVSFDQNPAALKTGVNIDTWDFVFTDRSPVTFRFRDGEVAVILYIQEFNRRLADPNGESVQSTRGLIRGEARYRFEVGDGVHLFRVGDVALTSEQEIPVDLRDFIQTKLEATFAKDYQVPSIRLPSVMSPERDQFLTVRYVTSSHGWLNVGWWLHDGETPAPIPAVAGMPGGSMP